jgi:UDP-GlcNAc:undecaprenyl-phosphate/decaprenyl-phosphate GlcNAc-1-phosphate transferase
MLMTLSTTVLIKLATLIITSVLLSLLISPIAILIANKLGLIDHPGSALHKKHDRPTPLAGGIALMISLLLLTTFYSMWSQEIINLVVGALVIFIFGILDDAFGFSAIKKFTGQILATGILLYAGISVQFLDKTLGVLGNHILPALHIGITLFWVVGITNAFNLTDSMDGLTAGLAAISAGFFTIACAVAGQSQLAYFSALIFGITISLYAINLTPAFSFLGDSGAQTLGFLLAVIGILYTPDRAHAPQGSTWFIPILLVAIPIFDTTLVTISRMRRKKPIFNADLGHTYHRLVKLGIPPGRAVLMIHLVAFLLGTATFIAINTPPLIATLVFFAICLVGLAGIIYLETKVKVE